jgi:Trp operon repressor
MNQSKRIPDKSPTEGRDGLLQELADIKRLLVLLLLKGGATQSELAKTLNVGQATISRQFGVGKIKSLTVDVSKDDQE